MSATWDPATPMPLRLARDCPRCHHEIVVAIDNAPVCSSYATNWCGWELDEHRDPARATTLETAISIEALRRVSY